MALFSTTPIASSPKVGGVEVSIAAPAPALDDDLTSFFAPTSPTVKETPPAQGEKEEEEVEEEGMTEEDMEEYKMAVAVILQSLVRGFLVRKARKGKNTAAAAPLFAPPPPPPPPPLIPLLPPPPTNSGCGVHHGHNPPIGSCH
jgi:hypothetical protein